MHVRWLTAFWLLGGLWCASIQAQVGKIPDEEFDRLHALIQPQPGESPWRDIDWLTNVTDARQRAAAEGKPIVIFTAADGSPLCRT